MRLDVRNTKPLVQIFCSHCISEKIDFWSDEKSWKLALARWFWAFFSNLWPNTQKNAQNRRAKTNFQFFSPNEKTIFWLIQSKQKIGISSFAFLTSRRIQRTHQNEKNSQLLNQCQKTMKTAHSGKLLLYPYPEIWTDTKLHDGYRYVYPSDPGNCIQIEILN